MEKTLKKIRTDFRKYMNGVVSYDMRKKGVNYKINFGIDIPRLRTMAKQYTPDKALANYMFEQDVREMKIMATMLYPVKEMELDESMEWIKSIQHQEVREHSCMNLLQHLPFADKLVENCLKSDEISMRTSGYCLYTRLAVSKKDVKEKLDFTQIAPIAIKDFGNESLAVKQAVFNALRHSGKNSKTSATGVLSLVEKDTSLNERERTHLYETLKDEFEFDFPPTSNN